MATIGEPKDTVLEKAQEAVDGVRNVEYGAPGGNHSTTATMFRAFLRRRYGTISAVQFDMFDVCAFNICQKLSRLANSPDHIDSLVDIAGYARNWEMCLDGMDVAADEMMRGMDEGNEEY